jgi:hypothetical protein
MKRDENQPGVYTFTRVEGAEYTASATAYREIGVFFIVFFQAVSYAEPIPIPDWGSVEVKLNCEGDPRGVHTCH